MKNFLTILGLVLAGVYTAEQAVGSEQPGTAKKQIVEDVVNDEAEQLGAEIPAFAPIGSMVNIATGIFNGLAVFKHSSATATPIATAAVSAFATPVKGA